MEWLEANREWFFSGAGIFIVSSVVGLLSIVATILIQRRNERRQRKRLYFGTSTTEFNIPGRSHIGGFSREDVRVSYQGKEYSNLKFFTIRLRNDGQKAIESQCVFLKFPDNTEVIEYRAETPNSMITADTEYPTLPDKLSCIVTFNRLEPGDACAIFALINSPSIEPITCEPRGVDDIDYVRSNDITKGDVNYFIIWLAAFFMFGSIPFVGGFGQALVIVAAAPAILRLLQRIQVSSISHLIQASGEGAVAVWGDVTGDIVIHKFPDKRG